MKVALVGYGKMGRAVEAAALERDWEVVARVGRGDTLGDAIRADVAIEFTHPSAVVSHLEALIEMGVPVVTGTTGWEASREHVAALAEKRSCGVLYGDNFSLGVHLFIDVVREAARRIDALGGYDVGGYEAHHNQKADSPSGTAKLIANALLESMESKSRATFEPVQRPVAEDELHFTSLRCGAIPGTHSVTFSSPGDTLTITHQAHNREAWARGALDAAEWLLGRTGLYSIQDMLHERQGGELCMV